jgi:hypothetical protein
MRALLAVAALAAVVLACAETPNPTLGPAFDEEAPPADTPPKGDPVGACSKNFSLSRSPIAFKYTNNVGRSPADDNADGWICFLITKEPTFTADQSTVLRWGVAVVIDNNIPPDEVGKCPLSFTATVAWGSEEDYNGNSVVCKVQAEDLGLVVVDDNHR